MKRLHDWHQKLEQLIWDDTLDTLPTLKRFIFFTLRIIHTIARDIAKGELSLRAMSLVYTTVISLVPLLAISFSVLKGLGKHKEIEPALLNFLEPLGDKRFEITEKIVQFVDNIQIGVLGAMGIALLIFSVISMMQKIERSFNFVWRIENERTIGERFSDYLSVLLLAPLFISLSVGMTTSVNTDTVETYLATIPFMGVLLNKAGHIIPYFVMAFAFGFIYAFMPNTQVSKKSAFVGGLFTAVIWKTMGIIFSTFVASSSQQTAIYSAFASIIVFMVWIYVGWLVLLIGSSIAQYHQYPTRMREKNSKNQLSIHHTQLLCLMVMKHISENFLKSQTAHNTKDELARSLGIDPSVVAYALTILTTQQLLIRSDDEPYAYYPAMPEAGLSPGSILKSIAQFGESIDFNSAHLPAVQEMEQHITKVT